MPIKVLVLEGGWGRGGGGSANSNFMGAGIFLAMEGALHLLTRSGGPRATMVLLHEIIAPIALCR